MQLPELSKPIPPTPLDLSIDNDGSNNSAASSGHQNRHPASPAPSDQVTDHNLHMLIRRRLHLSRAKLKGVTEMAALMAGFSVVATVELTIAKGTSEAFLIGFSVTTALLVTTTMLSIMIATCILPHLEAVAKLDSIELIQQSPHDALIRYIDLSWVLANTCSIFLFIVDVILLCWIKFYDRPEMCIAFTAIMVPVLILLCIFSLIFYRQSVQHQYQISRQKISRLIDMNEQLNIGNESRAPSYQSIPSFKVRV